MREWLRVRGRGSGDDRAAATNEKQNLDLALIGNSSVAALVDRHARIVWWCFPRFDSDPVFSRLLAGDEEKGFCDVALAGLARDKSQYLRNTAIVETILTDEDGGRCASPISRRASIATTAPSGRRRSFAASNRSPACRGLRSGCVRRNYGQPITEFIVGSNHIRYIGGAEVMRLTTDAPLSYIAAEITFH